MQNRARSEINAIDAGIIDQIANLLGDDDDAVRAWAAAALGDIGAPAKRTIPALERALREGAAPGAGMRVDGGLMCDLCSHSSIMRALQKIDGRPLEWR
jgi:hypothetical protein